MNKSSDITFYLQALISVDFLTEHRNFQFCFVLGILKLRSGYFQSQSVSNLEMRVHTQIQFCIDVTLIFRCGSIRNFMKNLISEILLFHHTT